MAAELRELVGIVAADWPADEQAEALAVALADPDAALVCFRTLVAERDEFRDQYAQARTRARDDDGMRPCTACANLTGKGQCLAVARGEPLGWGIAARRVYFPIMTDRPQRCAAYLPGTADPDKRHGAERWPWLLPKTPIAPVS